MTEEEILHKGEWLHDSLVLKINSKLFGKLLPIEVSFDQGEAKNLSTTSVSAINDFLRLTVENLQAIEEAIWKHCLACNQTQTSRGSSDGGKTWVDKSTTLEENLSEWGIKTKEDALDKSSIEGVWMANTWGKHSSANVFYLGISVAWDNEHGMNIIFRNGKLDDVE